MEIFLLLDFCFASGESLDPLLDLWPDFSLTPGQTSYSIGAAWPIRYYDSRLIYRQDTLEYILFPVISNFSQCDE